MSKPAAKDTTPVTILPTGDSQLIYAEQMIGMAAGPFVSKIVLGLDNAPNEATAKFTIVMPTNVLHLMAKQITDILSNQDTQKQLGDGFKTYQDSIHGK
ncbi:MAG: hypothetical protein Q7S71_02630 [Candidatus Nitrotoga sp.]|nr:hypothetical protein [Candidatus Nitrotoga sp.]